MIGSFPFVVGDLPAMVPATLDLNSWLIKILAVAGGAAVGGIGTDLLLRVAGRYFTTRPVPRPALNLARILGAITAGLVVWFWAFGTGGSDSGGLGGSLFGGKGGSTGSSEKASTGTTAPATVATGPSSTASETQTLHVIVLGEDRVKGDRFFLIEGEKEPLTVPDLKKAINERQRKDKVKVVEMITYHNSIARSILPWHDLEEWAENNQLTLKTVPHEGNLP